MDLGRLRSVFVDDVLKPVGPALPLQAPKPLHLQQLLKLQRPLRPGA